MGYAPHTNSDVASQYRIGSPNPLPILLGQFMEHEFGHTFEYATRQWPDESFHPELFHLIYVGDGQARLGKVLKTVAYVLTGDGELQKWKIKQHRAYVTDWIRNK